MSSKQINFFLSPEDLPDVAIFLIEKNCLIVKRKSETPDILRNYDIVKNPESIFQLCLCKNEQKEKIFYEYLENTDYYLDILKSNCIEFSIGGVYPYSNIEFHSSRFYYILKYYDNGEIVRKDEEFINWADDIFKSFKKKFLKKDLTYSTDFLSKKFIDWLKANNAKQTIDGTKFVIQ